MFTLYKKKVKNNHLPRRNKKSDVKMEVALYLEGILKERAFRGLPVLVVMEWPCLDLFVYLASVLGVSFPV